MSTPAVPAREPDGIDSRVVAGRSTRSLRLPSGLFLVLVSTGCALNVPAPRTVPQGEPRSEQAWTRVLATSVDERGRIDFAGIAKAPADLDAYVAWVGAVSPESSSESFPTPESRLAYYLNAYNALAMYDIVQGGVPESLAAMKSFHADSHGIPGS